jgi:hypothetical protein
MRKPSTARQYPLQSDASRERLSRPAILCSHATAMTAVAMSSVARIASNSWRARSATASGTRRATRCASFVLFGPRISQQRSQILWIDCQLSSLPWACRQGSRPLVRPFNPSENCKARPDYPRGHACARPPGRVCCRGSQGHQRRGYIRVPIDHSCNACLRPAAAFPQQLDHELGGTCSKRREIAIEFRTDLDELGPRRRKERVEVDRRALHSDRRAPSGYRVGDGTSPRGPGQPRLRLARRPDAAVTPFFVDDRQDVRSV